ncbi:MAG: ATP-dependent helicase, partial [Candidatus Eiseniibacteriota bacterium]
AARERCEEPVPVQVQALIEATHYLEHLEEDDPMTAEGRAENLEQLAAAAAHYAEVSGDPSLEGFLADVALVADLDEAAGPDEALVTLMTVHNAKGLEYELVLVAGLEQGLFPHVSALESESELDEERRLFYVALTRARRRVVLSAARSRLRYGRTEYQPVSQFVEELVAAAANDLEVIDRSGGESLWAEGGWRDGARALRGGGSRARDGLERSAGARRAERGGRPPLRVVRGSGAVVPARAAGRDGDAVDIDGADAVDAADLADRDEAIDLDPEDWAIMVGAPVWHAQFGRGRVVGQEGRGPDARLTVRFDGAFTKKVVARFLSLIEE